MGTRRTNNFFNIFMKIGNFSIIGVATPRFVCKSHGLQGTWGTKNHEKMQRKWQGKKFASKLHYRINRMFITIFILTILLSLQVFLYSSLPDF
jgi:hypothetical protein